MIKSRPPLLGRWVARGCYFGMWAWALSCNAAGIKGIDGSRARALPGVAYLLPAGLGRQAARAVNQRAGTGGWALAGKGTTTVASGVNAFLPAAAGRGVASDSSLGSGTVSYGNGTYTIPASVGRQAGGNLFESFSQFNLLENEVADFQGPSGIQNILARVTGRAASSIDGTITSGIQGANLFLINSAGVLFGQDAQLNVKGAFTVSTANEVKLADGGKFNASLGGDGLLTGAAVSAFRFVSAAPAPVIFMRSQLSVKGNNGLNVVAGDVTLDSATLYTPSGGLTIFSAASAGEAPFSLGAPGAGYGTASFSALGSLSLGNGSYVAIDGPGGGMIVVRAGNMSVDGSMILSVNSGPAVGGAIAIRVAGNLIMTGGGEINSSAQGLGKGGAVDVSARDIAISGAEPNDSSGIITQSIAGTNGGAAGNAGNVTVHASGTLDIEAGGEIGASTNSSGNCGAISVWAHDINISGASDGVQSGIAAESGAAGNAGNVTVHASGTLDIEAGGEIDASTAGSGNCGTIEVTAEDITIFGAAPGDVASGITASSEPSGQGGAAGDVMVRAAGTLEIAGGGEIASSTAGLGKGGSVYASARDITISGETPGGSRSAISAGSSSSIQGGAAGGVVVDASGNLDIQAGAEIDSSTSGLGRGGTVKVTAGDITISGATPDGRQSGINAQSESLARGGPAGDVVVRASGNLAIAGGGEIDTSTAGTGEGGAVNVRANDIVIFGATSNGVPSGITASSDSPAQGGAAGGVSIRCDNLLLDAAGTVAASAEAAGAGDITLHVGQAALEDGGSISTSAAMSGGNIGLTVGGLLYLADSSITATAGTLRNPKGASIGNAGNGGNITIDPEFIVLDDSLISANAAAGQGGNITLISNYYLNSGSSITATGATLGTVTISSPELDLSGALVGLPASPLGSETQLQETCAMAIQGDFSSFLEVGQGDIEAAPDEAQGDSGQDGRERAGHRKPALKRGGAF